MSRVLTDSITYVYAKCEKKPSLMFNPMTLFSKQNLFCFINQNPLDKPQIFIYSVKSRVFMHLWTIDFRVFTTRCSTPSQHFYGLSPSVIMSNRNYRVFHQWGIYPFLLCPTHIFFMLCNHETHFGRCPITELTTHSPRMMNDHNRAHTPNTIRCPHAYAMQKCQCMYLMLHV